MSTAAPPPSSVPFPALSGPRFEVGSVMTRTFGVWGRNLVPFSAVALVLNSPLFFLTIATGALRPGEGEPTVQGLSTVLGALLGFVLTGALTFGVLQSLGDRPVRFGEMMAIGFGKLWKILLVSIVVGVVAAGLAVLLLVPGIIAMCALWVAVPAAVVEEVGVGAALRRSRALTRGNRWTIFLVFLLFWLIGALVGGVYGFIVAVGGGGGAGAIPSLLVSQAVLAVVGALGAAAPAVAYHDLRVLKEGTDPSALAAVFD